MTGQRLLLRAYDGQSICVSESSGIECSQRITKSRLRSSHCGLWAWLCSNRCFGLLHVN